MYITIRNNKKLAHLHTPQPTHEKKNCSKVSFNLPTHESIPTPHINPLVCPNTYIHFLHVQPLINIYPSFIRDKNAPNPPISKSTHQPMRRRAPKVHP